LILGD
jgi:hypothetical protein